MIMNIEIVNDFPLRVIHKLCNGVDKLTKNVKMPLLQAFERGRPHDVKDCLHDKCSVPHSLIMF